MWEFWLGNDSSTSVQRCTRLPAYWCVGIKTVSEPQSGVAGVLDDMSQKLGVKRIQRSVVPEYLGRCEWVRMRVLNLVFKLVVKDKDEHGMELKVEMGRKRSKACQLSAAARTITVRNMSHPLIYENRDCEAWFDDLLRLLEDSIEEPRTVFDRSHTPWVIRSYVSSSYLWKPGLSSLVWRSPQTTGGFYWSTVFDRSHTPWVIRTQYTIRIFLLLTQMFICHGRVFFFSSDFHGRRLAHTRPWYEIRVLETPVLAVDAAMEPKKLNFYVW